MYVCGEETALLEYLESHRGEPRARPPYPAQHGLHGKPTAVHNVETLCWLPAILRRGGDWFRQQGGLKLASLTGAVEQPGLYEVSMNTTLGELLAKGGGVPGGGPAGAFAVGGTAGGLLPPDCADTPLNREALRSAGAVLGTATVHVLDASTCVVHEALAGARFFRDASCGKCTACRVGTAELSRLWSTVAAGGASGARPRLGS